MTVGFLQGRSGYEEGPLAPLDYVEAILARFSRKRDRLGSAGICGACCPMDGLRRVRKSVFASTGDDLTQRSVDRGCGETPDKKSTVGENGVGAEGRVVEVELLEPG